MKIGQIVCLKSNNFKKGVITQIDDDIIHVFIDNCNQTFFESQLSEIIEDSFTSPNFASYEDFSSYMTAIQLNNQNKNNILSLNTGKIDFIPYQYRPVLKFIKSDQPRILIADSVGVGKTIEAELILKELEARQEIESVAIICPKPLISERKWENELKRFGEDFEPLDGQKLKTCIETLDTEGEWPTKYKKCIIPYSIFDNEFLFGKKIGKRIIKKSLIDLDPPPHFDLIIVDEAHHIKNTATSRYQIVKYFVENSTAAIFLTATPIEIQSSNLFVLLNLLRPDLFLDIQTFNKMLEPNQYINKAVVSIRKKNDNWNKDAYRFLETAINTTWGNAIYKNNPSVQEILENLKNSNISNESRIRLITKIEQLNSFANVINRTRRRDIGTFTLRKPQTIRVAFTHEQECFYQMLLNIQKKVLNMVHGNVNVAFMMNMLQRQAASCINGMVPLINAIISRDIIKITEEFYSIDNSNIEDLINSIKGMFEPLKEKAAELPDEDPKFDNLLTLIQQKQLETNNKIIIFSTFRHTLSYLLDKLTAYGFRAAVIHGDVPDEERRCLRKRFMQTKEDSQALDILLFSEVGCEGLDYQFCNYMINYDLPWNPMKIEQRIGRIDRNGQESEFVTIVNMITENTVDQIIYDRCLNRIGIFENSIGDSEEILGTISEQIENIISNQKLSKEDKEAKLQQLADNEIREIQENEKLENEQYNLLGIEINNSDFEKELENAKNIWLTSDKLKSLITTYLEHRGISTADFSINKEIYTIRLSREKKGLLLEDFNKISFIKSNEYQNWRKWLKFGSQYLTIAFKNSERVSESDCILLNINHPFVKQAAASINISKPKYIKINNPQINKRHYFVIYDWTFFGIYKENKIVFVSDDDSCEELIKKELALQTNFSASSIENIDSWNYLNEKHKIKWETEKNSFINKTKKIINYKKQSLITSINSQINLAKGQLSQVSDENIIKMRKKEIVNLETEKQRKLTELEDSLNTVDITFKILAYGIIDGE